MLSFASLALNATVGAFAPAGPDCVILLHGLARTSRSMAKLERALSADGYRVVNVDYPSRKYPIETLSELAITQGLAGCAGVPVRQVHFVTHSLGGILVRHYLSKQTIPNLGKVVMLAPPNQGSAVVDVFSKLPGYRWINGPAGYQLGTSSASVPLALGAASFPVGIIAGTRSINWILSLALAHPDDGKVSVEGTKLEGMSDFATYPVSHPFIMKNDRVIGQVRAFLDTGAFDHRARPCAETP